MSQDKVPGLPSIWNVPYRRNPFFTGREDVLNNLHEALTAGKTAALTQSQAIIGLGGIGKTQTAVEYAYRYGSEYQAVLWVKADTFLMLILPKQKKSHERWMVSRSHSIKLGRPFQNGGTLNAC